MYWKALEIDETQVQQMKCTAYSAKTVNNPKCECVLVVLLDPRSEERNEFEERGESPGSSLRRLVLEMGRVEGRRRRRGVREKGRGKEVERADVI